MNEVTIKGEVKFVDEVREYGANGFRKQEVVVETGDGRWDNPIAVEFTKDNIEKSQGLKKGDRVTIEARVNGREWTGRDGVTKWFTSIAAYKVETEGGSGEIPLLPCKPTPTVLLSILTTNTTTGWTTPVSKPPIFVRRPKLRRKKLSGDLRRVGPRRSLDL